MNNESNGTKAKTDVIAEFLDTQAKVGVAMDLTIEELETRQEPVITPFEMTEKLSWPALFSRMTDIDQWILDVDQVMSMNPLSHKTNIEASLQMDRIMEEMKGLAKELGFTFVLEGKVVYADLEGTGLLEKFEPLAWQEDSEAVALVDKLKGKSRLTGGDFDFPVHLKYSETDFGEALVWDAEQIAYPRKPTKNVAVFGGHGKHTVNIVDAILANVAEAYRAMPAPSPCPLEKESWKQTKIRRGKGHNKFKRRK